MDTTVAPKETARGSAATAKMRAALRFAGSRAGRLVLGVRGLFGNLGPFGAALLALYPVAIVVTIAITGSLITGRVTPM